MGGLRVALRTAIWAVRSRPPQQGTSMISTVMLASSAWSISAMSLVW